MRFLRIYLRVFVFACGIILPATANSTTGSTDVNELLDSAEDDQAQSEAH